MRDEWRELGYVRRERPFWVDYLITTLQLGVPVTLAVFVLWLAIH